MKKYIFRILDLEISKEFFLLLTSLFFISITLITLTGCGGGDSGFDKLIPNPFASETPISSSGSEPYTPTQGTPISHNDSEGCKPTETAKETISIDSSPISFDVGEIANRDNDIECATLAIDNCANYSAEIDADGASITQFYLSRIEDAAEVTTRLNGSGPFKICYKRSAEGRHSARVQLTSTGGESFAAVINVTGATLPPFFNLSSPKEGQLIWKQATGSTYNSATNQFTVPASGKLSEDVRQILSSQEVEIACNGKKEKVAIASDGSFSSTLVVPFSPAAIYPATFTVKTSEGKFKKVVNLIRYTSPEGTIEIRDEKNSRITSLKENAEDPSKSKGQVTDSAKLTLGLIVDNLPLSSPTVDKSLTASLVLKRIGKGTEAAPDKSALVFDGNSSWVAGTATSNAKFSFSTEERKRLEDSEAVVPGRCSGGFDKPDLSYCVLFPKTDLLAKGRNTIVATICSDFTRSDAVIYPSGCSIVETSVLVDNGIPTIEVSSPVENSIYAVGSDIFLKGTLSNFIRTSTEMNDVDGVSVPKVKQEVKIWVNTAAEDGKEIELTDTTFKITELAETNLATANRGNIKKALFSLNLNSPEIKNRLDGELKGSIKDNLTLFTNFIHIKVKNSQGHVATKTVSFQRGEYKASNISGTGTSQKISTQHAGRITATNAYQTPVMLALSEGVVKDESALKALQMVANKLDLRDLIQGYVPETEDDPVRGIKKGEIPADLMANSHLTGIPKLKAWIDNNRRSLNPNLTNNTCGFNTMGTCAVIAFPKNLDDPRLFGPNLKNESFWSPVVFGKRNAQGQLLDESGRTIETKANGWPQNNADIARIAPDYDFDDYYQGPITINSAELKQDTLDLDLTIHGLKGHIFIFAVCQYGSLSFPPVMPSVFNIKELRLKVPLQVKRIQLGADGKELTSGTDAYGMPIAQNRACVGGQCTNKVIIDPTKFLMTGDELLQSIVMTAGEDCADDKVGHLNSQTASYTPMGCHLGDRFTSQGHPRNHPILIETRNKLDYLAWSPGPSLNFQVKEVLRNTFKDMLSCDMPNHQINPLIDKTIFPRQDWIRAGEMTTDAIFAVGTDEKGDVQFGFEEDVDDPMFTLKPNLKDAELKLQDGGIKVKLPLSVGASGLGASSGINALNLRKGISSRNRADISYDKKEFSSQAETDKNLRTLGYMFRTANPNLDINFPELPANKINDVYSSISLGIEEIVQSAAHVLWQKGPLSVLDLIDKKWKHALTLNNWKLAVDDVRLAQLGYCGSLDVIQATLPPGILFTNVSHLFTNPDGSHWEISLDKNSPPTIAILPVQKVYPKVPLTDKGKLIELGLSNVRVAIKDHVKNAEDKYIRNGKQLFTVRIDLTIRIVVKYDETKKLLEAFILPLDKTPLYLSVVDRGGSYNDEAVISALRDLVLKKVWEKLAKDAYDENESSSTSTTENKISPSIAFKLGDSVSGIDNILRDTKTDANGNDIINDFILTDFLKFDSWDAGEEGSVLGNFIAKASVGECKGGDEPLYVGQTVVDKPNENTTTEKPDDETDERIIACKKTHEEADNKIQKALCVAGIEDIIFPDGSPKIVLDSDNGYLHVATSLVLSLYDWVYNGADE